MMMRQPKEMDDKEIKEIKEPQDVADFLLNASLYEQFSFVGGIRGKVDMCRILDFYCCSSECKKDATHKRTITRDYNSKREQGVLNLNMVIFKCSRCGAESVFYLEYAEVDALDSIVAVEKVGQYPSLATLTQQGIQKYRKTLDGIDFQELNRAIGLHAHGVGVGSFVYLRRIFERLINKAMDECIADGDKTEDDFKTKMTEKIDLLKAYVPEFVYEERNTFYSIVSKGIHDLSEDECKKLFPAL